MKPLLLILLVLAGAAALAQETSALRLKPIEIAPGPRYFYEVPFLEANDGEVLRLYRNAKRLRSVERVVALVPLGYLLYTATRSANSRQSLRNGSYWTVVGGTLVVGLSLNIVRNGTMRRAVVLYNQRLPRAAFGVLVEPLPTGGTAPGLGLAVKF